MTVHLPALAAAAAATPEVARGIAAALAVAAVARGLAGLAPPVIGEVFLAVIIGIGIGIALPLRVAPVLRPGLRFAMTWVLRAGVVLLGARLTIGAVAEVGLSMVVVIGVVIVAALALALAAGRMLGLPPATTILIAVGTAICGNSAILAAAPVIDADEREVAVAVATITTFGMLAVLTYPVIGAAVGLSDGVFGRWAGVAVHDTSQVVAAGFARSPAAGELAVIVKLVRNAAMAPVLAVVAWAWSRRLRKGDPEGEGTRLSLRDAVPLFVLGFLLMAAARSLGLLEAEVGGESLAVWAGELSAGLILVAVAAIGLNTDLRVLWATGPRAFLAGLGVAFVVALVGLALVLSATPAQPIPTSWR